MYYKVHENLLNFSMLNNLLNHNLFLHLSHVFTIFMVNLCCNLASSQQFLMQFIVLITQTQSVLFSLSANLFKEEFGYWQYFRLVFLECGKFEIRNLISSIHCKHPTNLTNQAFLTQIKQLSTFSSLGATGAPWITRKRAKHNVKGLHCLLYLFMKNTWV